MSFIHLGPGEKAPEVVNVVIEIPKGSHNKYEYDEKMDEIRLDRVLYSAVFYPTDYGFIPQTRSDDKDHLDIMVVISEPLFSGCVVSARPIGVLDMEDEEGKDVKIIAVALNDPRLADVNNISDLDEHYKKEIHNFFEVYKNLEKKPVKVHRWENKEEAYRVIKKAISKYKEENTSAA
jgi:inorganic pyrophosphatase